MSIKRSAVSAALTYVFDWKSGQPHQIFRKMYESGAKLQVVGNSIVVLEPDAAPPETRHWTRDVIKWQVGAFKVVTSGPAAAPH